MISTDTLSEALFTIQSACTERGILASAGRRDNYARIWSRDSAMAGLAASLYGDEAILRSWGASIDALGDAQTDYGQIPSNVSFEGGQMRASYGTLAGRVDACSWWVISASAFLRLNGDATRAVKWLPKVEKALNLLHIWEMNNRGLVYTPLGGNWADEYVCSGYLLYDQLLRIWALRAAAAGFGRAEWALEAERITELVRLNYAFSGDPAPRYHPAAYARTEFPELYWCYGLGPNGYDTRWDLAANALALVLGVNPDAEPLTRYLHQFAGQLRHWMLPAFWPVIHPGHPDWRLLAENHLYAFKNQPFCFHNGGCWPVFLGWLALGLALSGQPQTAARLADALESAISTAEPGLRMCEYWRTDTLKPGGVPQLCFTASGVLLAAYATQQHTFGLFKNAIG